MDGSVVARHNWGMRRRLLVGFLVVVSAIYVVLVLWAFTRITIEPADLVWTLVMVPGGVIPAYYLIWRRPGHPIGEMLALGMVWSLVLLTIFEIPTVAVFEDRGAESWMWAPIWIAQTAALAGVVIISILLAVLPDGKTQTTAERRFSKYSWVVVAFPTLALFTNAELTPHSLSFPGVSGVESPFYVESLDALGPWSLLASSLGYLVLFGGLWLQVKRYRRASLRHKKQVRWVLYAGVVAGTLALIPFLLSELGFTGEIPHTVAWVGLLSGLAVVIFPTSVAVAVLEPSWVDVDIVIRKSFVYGSLSFLILALYVGVAAGLGLVAGRAVQIELAVFITVVVAVAFQPARRWLQGLADRWVFGERPSTHEAVAEIGSTIGEASDPESFLPHLAETVRQTLGLKWVTVELDNQSTAGAGKVEGEPEMVVPILDGTRTLGVIQCGPKIRGSWDEEETRLVATLAGQAGLAIAKSRLAGRIVTASEEERRRIERNIHDGAQQELVALVARLGMAKKQAANGGVSPDELDSLQSEAQHILSELRELAQGIHPSVLADGGIVEAIEDKCSHAPISVSVHAPASVRSLRFGDEIEGAAYFFVIEALTNVLRHSGASRADIRLGLDNGDLDLTVEDNGRGFKADDVQLNGLAGLEDRLTALGGQLTVASGSSGTTVTATLPVSDR